MVIVILSDKVMFVLGYIILKHRAGLHRMFREKRASKRSASVKLKNGLRKLNDTDREINDMMTELENATGLIAKHAKECEETLAAIAGHVARIDEQKRQIDAVSVELKRDESKCRETCDLATAELKLAIPGLEDALNVSRYIRF